MTDTNDLTLRLPAHILESRPYQPGKPIDALAREIGVDPDAIVKLASNENPLGMSEAARAALAQAAHGAARYPDNDCHALVQALSRKLDVPANWLVLGNGSECVLGLAATAFLEPGRHALYAQYSFQAFINAVQRTGAQHKVVAAREHGCDLDAMLGAIDSDTSLVYIANPGNPTGSFVPGAALERFIARVPRDVPVLLDEAYYEYLPDADHYDSLAWVRRFPNLIVTRTFSKAYGLAGLRVGYGIAQAPLAALLNRIRPAFVVTEQAERAAVAALDDEAFLARSRMANERGLAQWYAGLDALGLPYLRSRGNFVLAQVGDAAAINTRLLRQGVIVRPVGVYGLPQWLRISVGTEEENVRCLAALKSAMEP
ncbi:Histidinol-phosphate aminotransferase [Paraburkholderia caffeinitolerans]|uniref:Histidinol-phosphate aminotransferase n=1 Tax=Paraburkholderia caffeinitolerans TaxID=1723730 RepID=A0A6J5GHA9_9BURK|nr:MULTISPECIES: histidinol-phosphate transaminase [Paraburkholderia]CAB3798804.1 Histidinol-phosphate aminotransferase [Paraburkholderia caffeinitolerans]